MAQSFNSFILAIVAVYQERTGELAQPYFDWSEKVMKRAEDYFLNGKSASAFIDEVLDENFKG